MTRRQRLMAPAGGEATVEMYLGEALEGSRVKWSSGSITSLGERFNDDDPSSDEILNSAVRNRFAFETCLDIERIEYLCTLAWEVPLARGHDFYGWFNPNPWCGEIDFAQ